MHNTTTNILHMSLLRINPDPTNHFNFSYIVASNDFNDLSINFNEIEYTLCKHNISVANLRMTNLTI